MIEKILKFDNIRVNKKEFHKFKQPLVVLKAKLWYSEDVNKNPI